MNYLARGVATVGAALAITTGASALEKAVMQKYDPVITSQQTLSSEKSNLNSKMLDSIPARLNMFIGMVKYGRPFVPVSKSGNRFLARSGNGAEKEHIYLFDKRSGKLSVSKLATLDYGSSPKSHWGIDLSCDGSKATWIEKNALHLADLDTNTIYTVKNPENIDLSTKIKVRGDSVFYSAFSIERGRSEVYHLDFSNDENVQSSKLESTTKKGDVLGDASCYDGRFVLTRGLHEKAGVSTIAIGGKKIHNFTVFLNSKMAVADLYANKGIKIDDPAASGEFMYDGEKPIAVQIRNASKKEPLVTIKLKDIAN